MKPFLLVTFADNSHDPLKHLHKEREEIERILTELDKREEIDLRIIPDISISRLFANFSNYSDRLTLFHYGGHAGSQELVLQDQHAHAEGLAQLIGQKRNLKLVFLNGCSTQGQVETLLSLGVPAVIATHSPIQDYKATEFSTQFYQALANQQNIKEAFNTAVAYLKTKYDSLPDIVIRHYRPSRLREEFKDIEEQPWGLFSQDATALDWIIPSQKKNNDSSRNTTVHQHGEKNYNVNNEGDAYFN